MNKTIIASLILTVVAIGGIIMLLRGGTGNPDASTGATSNVIMADGKQVIQIDAKGGYAPRSTVAKANIPTTINVQTNGTFDCSSALAVPAVGFRTMLPSSGITPVEIPPQKPGTTIRGICSMGMYSFAVNFN